MYHDEFEAKRSGRRTPVRVREDRAAGLAFGAGGGMSLAMAADLVARPYLPALFDLAAMLPLAVTSACILVRRCFEVRDPAPTMNPSPAASSIHRGPTRRPAWTGARRVGSGRTA